MQNLITYTYHLTMTLKGVILLNVMIKAIFFLLMPNFFFLQKDNLFSPRYTEQKAIFFKGHYIRPNLSRFSHTSQISTHQKRNLDRNVAVTPHSG